MRASRAGACPPKPRSDRVDDEGVKCVSLYTAEEEKVFYID